MMPYAVDNQISQSPIEGGIEITQAQYQMALAGMLAGKQVMIAAGEMVVNFPPEPEPPAPPEPPILTLEQMRQLKLADINSRAEGLVATLSGKDGYPASEIDTWPTQQSEAAAWYAAGEVATPALVPWCAQAAQARGIPLADFVARVQAKVDAYRQLSAAVFGYRQGLEDQITAAVDEAELAAIEWVNPIQLGE